MPISQVPPQLNGIGSFLLHPRLRRLGTRLYGSILVVGLLIAGGIFFHRSAAGLFPELPGITVDPSPATLSELQVAHLTANTGGRAIVWSKQGPGTLTTIDGSHAVYTAPETIKDDTPVLIRANAQGYAAPATITVTLRPAYHWQGLVQLQNGMARAGTKPSNLQPQGYWVVFNDATTGAEIWQVDGDESPGTIQIPGILNRTPWNANGSRFALSANRCVPGAYCGDTHVFVYSADGSTSRLIRPYDPTRQPQWKQPVPIYGYAPWDRQKPNLLYWATANDTANGFYSTPQSTLYAIDISAGDLTTKVIGLPNPTRRREIQSYPSEDNILIVQDSNSQTAPHYVVNLYMVDLNRKTLLYSYPINFGLTALGHSQDQEYHLHDIYFRRNAADTYIFNYGPRGDVGEAIFFEAPLNGDRIKVKVAFADPGTATPYYSHPAWNSDGSLVAYGGESELNSNKFGAWVRNHNRHATLAKVGQDSGHIGWDGYDPNYLVFDGWTSAASFDLRHAAPDGSWSKVLVKYPPRDRNRNTGGLLIGPAQSPDATKVMFSIPLQDWIHGPLKTYITVDHRPISPQLKVIGTSPVQLQWTPYLTHREVRGYHVYRSTKADSGYVEISKGLVAGTSFEDTGATAGSALYYMVTAEEYSGLESDSPANVVQVTVGGRAKQVSMARGTRWYSTSPAAPAKLATSKVSSGAWKLTWAASPSANIRYYNIYYSTAGAPQPTQTYQVASVPAGQTSFTYWLADPMAPSSFGIVAVDRQGNRSAMATFN
jgi:hypothetical protein